MLRHPSQPRSLRRIRGGSRAEGRGRGRAAAETVSAVARGTEEGAGCERGGGAALSLALERARAAAAAAAAAAALFGAPPAFAALDAAATGRCILSNCQVPLARCLADEKCLENLVCLQGCSGKPDEADCQIRCGDLYQSPAIATFNTCAVTAKKCVPQKPDDNSYPEPAPEKLVQKFDTGAFDGRWYIVAGLNRLFDTFDCQVHYFTAPAQGKLYGKLNWRVERANGQFYERSDVQTFEQDPQYPGILYNKNNPFLNYQDTWYILKEKPKEYIVVYYRGSNDAWDGYGGAVIYATQPKLTQAQIEEITEVLPAANLSWSDFMETDNTCGPEPRRRVIAPRDLDDLAQDVLAIEEEVARDVVGLEREVVREFEEVEKEVPTELAKLRDALKRDANALGKEGTRDLALLADAVQETEAFGKELASFARGFTIVGRQQQADLSEEELAELARSGGSAALVSEQAKKSANKGLGGAVAEELALAEKMLSRVEQRYEGTAPSLADRILFWRKAISAD
mmetsp:Transcript_858/g.3153  ORF Transcript_858/g.3153 Transcript_858/m.3153 type:complete len:513 (-) Transcript_858:100-1638(-)